MPAQKAPKSAAKAVSPTSLPIKDLDQLAAWLAKAPVNEVEVEQKGVRIRLSKGTNLPSGAVFAPAPSTNTPSSAQPADTSANSAANAFKSPMVGTFYSAASPDSQPFVKVGDSVQSGQTLCIIEAMKTMNQISSDRSGKVTKILIQNASPVEFGQPLFVIE